MERNTPGIGQRFLSALLIMSLALSGVPYQALATELEGIGNSSNMIDDEDSRKTGAEDITVDEASGTTRIVPQNSTTDISTVNISEIGSHYYTGEERKPEPDVWLGSFEYPGLSGVSDQLLTKGLDYVLSYSNNVNVGKGIVTVTGIGSYSGSVDVPFKITDNATGFVDIGLNYTTFEYDGTAKEPIVMRRGKPYSDSIAKRYVGDTHFAKAQIIDTKYENNINVGQATVIVSLDMNNVQIPMNFSITPANLDKATLGTIAAKTYTGSSIVPDLKLTYNGMTLVKDTDYDVECDNNVSVGTASVTIIGKGNYQGTKITTFEIGKASPKMTFAEDSISKSITDAAFTNTLSTNADGTVSYESSNVAVATVNHSTGQVTIKGEGTTTITASAAEGANFKTGSASYVLTVRNPITYTISYDANGGTGTPSSQYKNKGVSLTLNDAKPTKTYVVSYNANGGSVTPASKNVSCTFKAWNTDRSGRGISYSPGAAYKADSDVTLYAQWNNPAVGTLAKPTRNGYVFSGWFTAAVGGTEMKEISTVNGNTTVYAHWTNAYSLGEETYSFSNYGDSDSPFGHCFGMSITSSGYYNSLIDIKKIGGTSGIPLYSFDRTQIVKQPICYYQGIQGSYASRATVAGGSYYLHEKYDIASDWSEVVNYVKDHSYDNTGMLQIGFRKNKEGGHAINFLRYEKVNGQDRIYAYDNNFPTYETYFYKDKYGRVLQAPTQTFSGEIDCIALRNCRTYFGVVGDFDSTHVIYVAKDTATIPGYSYSLMESDQGAGEYVMYEIPTDKDSITIVPSVSNADFIYMDTEYSFGNVTDATRGELKLATMNEGAIGSDASFMIYEASSAEPVVTLSKTTYTYDKTVHAPKVTVKVGGTTLKESTDYIVSYPSGMVNAGSYEIKVTLIGKYDGTVTKTFTITRTSSILALKSKSTTYTGEVLAYSGKVTRTGSSGKMTYKYYSDSSCKKEVAASKVVNVGTYYVRATLAADKNHTGATSNIAKFTITPKKETPMVTLASTTYSYTGKNIKPLVTVKVGSMKLSSSQFTVTWPKDAKTVGDKSVTVSLKGNYSGTNTASYSIVPKGTALSKVEAASKGFTVNWKKQATQATGYEIQYSPKKSFDSGNRTVKVPETKTTSIKLTKLNSKKTYYVRVRIYKKVGSKTYYSDWSMARSVKVK